MLLEISFWFLQNLILFLLVNDNLMFFLQSCSPSWSGSLCLKSFSLLLILLLKFFLNQWWKLWFLDLLSIFFGIKSFKVMLRLFILYFLIFGPNASRSSFLLMTFSNSLFFDFFLKRSLLSYIRSNSWWAIYISSWEQIFLIWSFLSFWTLWNFSFLFFFCDMNFRPQIPMLDF